MRRLHDTLRTMTGTSSNPRQRGIAKPRGKLSALQQRMRKKLSSAQFRMLNESMYTHTGATSKAMMDANPDLFGVYHSGYAEQVRQWPKNPLDNIIKYLSTQKQSLKIIDLGCGEARLAKEISHQKVHSFDLVAVNDTVCPCDMAHLPLQGEYADVTVFCLSLMGTNYGDFLREAYRVMKARGLMLIAEVASRFEDHNPSSFITGVESLGFRLLRDHPLTIVSQEHQNSSKRKKRKKRPAEIVEDKPVARSSAFFYHFAFRKVETKGKDSELPPLAACVYKRR